MSNEATGYTTPVKFSSTGNYGCGPDDDEDDVYTVSEFIELCKLGAFIDYDGYGYPVKNNLANKSVAIYPSQRTIS